MIFVWSLKFYHKPVRSCSILAKKKARFYVGFGVSQTPIIKYYKEEMNMFGENLKAMRKAKGYTQEELAIKLNVVRETVSNQE